jgi:hypothetical protein
MNAASAIATKMAITVSFMLIDADVVPNFMQTIKKIYHLSESLSRAVHVLFCLDLVPIMRQNPDTRSGWDLGEPDHPPRGE